MCIDSICEKGLTPLLTAAKKGYTDIAKKLLELGANVNAVSKDQKTCLHFAVHNTDPSFLQLLLKVTILC